jgi:hypothetical protein
LVSKIIGPWPAGLAAKKVPSGDHARLSKSSGIEVFQFLRARIFYPACQFQIPNVLLSPYPDTAK